MGSLAIVHQLIWIGQKAWWAAAGAWRSAKDVVELTVPFGNEVAHVLAGMLIFGTLFLVGTYSRGWRQAWILTFAIALCNELVDITTERWPDILEQVAEGAFDLVLTMSLPTLASAAWTWRGVQNASPSQK